MSDNVLSDTPCNCSTVAGSCRDYNDVKIKTVLRKIVRDFGLACVFPFLRNRNSGDDEKSVYNHDTCDMEQNKAWLLAESGGCGGGGGDELINADPQSVHSSFRFSICSQIELDSMSVSSSTNSTVLMVNLSNGSNESKTLEMKWRSFQSIEKSISPVTNALTRFSYPEISAATRGFSKDRVLGRGALSYVFRGKLGFVRTTVAIKRLEKDDKESPKSFCRELMIASSLKNTFIVPLLGFCIDHEEGLFLVYKYVSGGSLDRHLHEKKKKKKSAKGFSVLSCSVRYKVALGIAEAIAYLQNGTERCVVHRDIKPCNILLSSKRTPMLCDFGLATWTSAPSVPFLCKTVKGTFGYLAPEYFQHGKVSDKTDVYAFGVVLLELITGRKPIEAKRPSGEENLVQWAKPLLHKKIEAMEELLDPCLKCTSKSFATQIERMIQAAAACLANEESHRPGIQEILTILRGNRDGSIYLNRRKKRFSGLYSLSQETENEMNRRLALATLAVSELEDDDHLFWR